VSTDTTDTMETTETSVVPQGHPVWRAGYPSPRWDALPGGQVSYAPSVPITPKKAVSYSTPFVLCFAIGLFALLMLDDRTVSAHAYASLHPMDASSSPSSGPIGATISVNGSGLAPAGAAVTFGYTTTSCSQAGFNAANTSDSDPTVKSDGSFSGWFVWPSTSMGMYTVCIKITGNSSSTVVPASSYQVLSTSAPSVSVDHSSYKVGDKITVTGSNFYPSGTAVTIKLAAPDGSKASTLGNSVTTDSKGSFTQVYKAPGNPTGTLVIVATGGSGSPPPLQATSSHFAIKKKPEATPTPTPTSEPASTPILPPPVFVGTPTSAPAPSPTVALAPMPAPVVTPTTSPSSNLLGGRLPLILAIGLGALLALGILFVVGRLVLRKYLSPAPLPKVPPSGALPWSRSQEESLHGNMIMNDIPFAQTMPHKTPFPPGNGGYPPGPGNSPFPPGNTPQPEQAPFYGPFGPGNGEVAPENGAQEPFPPNDRFGPPNQ
jgi:hypothetical protein